MWRVGIAVTAGLMAVTDAMTSGPRWRVEAWVLLLFFQTVASVFLLDDVRTLRQKLRAVSWLAGVFLGLYNGVWVVTEAARGNFFSNVGLYPFGLNVSWMVFGLLTTLGFFLMYEGACP